MKRRWMHAALATALLGTTLVTQPAQAATVTLVITGSTQMYTLGQLLAAQFDKTYPNVNISVTPSSGQAGFDQACTIHELIGMTDAYISDDQLRESGCGDMVGIPVAISATIVVYNLPGSYFKATKPDGFTLQHPVRLTAPLLARIYMGTIKMWNDPAIKAINPGMALPAQPIRAFNSAEPGGSGFVFDQWLAFSDSTWNKTVGVSYQPSWPANHSTGTPSSGTMVQAIEGTPYSIGFVGFDYAISNNLQAAALLNASGAYQTPSLNGLSYAIAKQLHLGMPGDFRRSFVTVPDANAFNPADFEFFVVHQNLRNPSNTSLDATTIKQFLAWCIAENEGQKFIESIEFHRVAGVNKLVHGYIPVPPVLAKVIAAKVAALQV